METKSLLLGESATDEHVEGDRRGDRERARGGARDPHDDPAPRTGRAARGREDRGAATTRRADEVAAGIDAVEARIREAVPIARVIYLEPDIYDQKG